MSRSTRRKEKYMNKDEIRQDQLDDGTAARTRPYSFDEIMLRRKNKKQSGKVDGPGPVRAHSSASKGTENVRELVELHASDELLKDRSQKKEEFSKKGEVKDSRATERKLKSVLNRGDTRDKVKEDDKAKPVRDKRKKGDRSSDDSENEPGRRHSKYLVPKDGYTDRNRGKSETVSKRRNQEEDDDRARVRSLGKKHELQKRPETELSERKEKKDASQLRHEDSWSKRRRSRSRERDRDTNRRSRSREQDKIKNRRSRSREPDKDKPRRSGSREHDKDKSRRSRSREHDKGKRRRSRSREHVKDKNRRSRSREHDNEKSRKSSSPSTRGHKHRSSDVQEHEELASYYQVGDRRRLSSNGTINKSRRHDVSASRLGGYSPRKRRSAAAVRTPSPASRSPEKKNAGWDLPPVTTESKFPDSVLSKLPLLNQTEPSTTYELSNVVPVTSSTPKAVGILSSIASINASVDSIQLTQATRPKRRIYVENLPSSASEETVMECLNNYLLSSGVNLIQGTQPCISCIVNKEKGQALVEFLTPEYASAVLSFDGRSLSGNVLKIRRPKDYVEVTIFFPRRIGLSREYYTTSYLIAPAIGEESGQLCSLNLQKGWSMTGAFEKPVASAAVPVRDVVEDSLHKIFVGRIPKVISSEMLLEIASTFGPLKAYRFVTSADLNEPYAFLEYLDQSVTLRACAGMNGMKLGGQMITVIQAFPDASSLENIGVSPFYGVPMHARPLLQKPKEVLKLKNVFDPQTMSSVSEPELEDILEDIRLECVRFGLVKSINVVKDTTCSISPEACEVTDNTDSAVNEDSKNIASPVDEDNDDKKGEDDTMIFDSENIRKLEPSISDEKLEELEPRAEGNTNCDDKQDLLDLTSCAIEPEEGAKIVEANGICGIKIEDSLMKDEICDSAAVEFVVEKSLQDSSPTLSQEFSHQLKTEIVDEVNHNEITTEIVSTGNLETDKKDSSSVQASLKLEEESEKLGIVSPRMENGTSKKVDDVKNGENKEQETDLKSIFEPGCVLVEYRRAEASSMAAHCLHGRLFDGRVVTVEYIDPDLYRARFP